MSLLEGRKLTRLDEALRVFKKRFDPSNPDGPAYKICGFDRKSYSAESFDSLQRWGQQTNMHSVLALLDKYETAVFISEGPVAETGDRSEGELRLYSVFAYKVA